MTKYTLIANRKDGTQAIVQHDTEHATYLYTFDDVRTYTLLPLDLKIDQEDWETDYGETLSFPTMEDLQIHVQHRNHIHLAYSTPHDLGFGDE